MPSDPYVVGTLAGKPVAFLARHGRGHRYMPSELNFRANIWGFRTLGVERIVSLSAVGSLKQEHEPLHFVIPDQFFDRTAGRISTFFGNGLVAHVSMADPVCAQLRFISRMRAGRPASSVSAVEPTSAWKGPRSRPGPNPTSIAPGAWTSSA